MKIQGVSSLACSPFSALAAGPCFVLHLKETQSPAFSLGSCECPLPSPQLSSSSSGYKLKEDAKFLSVRPGDGGGDIHTRLAKLQMGANLFGELLGSLSTL